MGMNVNDQIGLSIITIVIENTREAVLMSSWA
jgi:hypothetical protein